LTVLAHGLLHAAGTQQTLWRAVLALAAFAVVGSISGQLAGWIVGEAVRDRLIGEMTKRSAEAPAATRADSRGGNLPRGGTGVKT
jgi:membrane protein YqaA with SNARE-associated domain